MTAEVKSALDEARSNLASVRQVATEQERADLQFAQMFQACATFLESTPESRVPNLGARIFLRLITKPLSLLPVVGSRITRTPINDLADQRRLTASLNGTGEPIQVTLQSGTAVPSQTGSRIILSITGLPEELRLARTHAEILYTGIPRATRDSFTWRANLRDVARFQTVVDELTKPQA